MDDLTLKTSLLCQGIDFGESTLKRGRVGGAGPAGAGFEVENFVVNIPTSKLVISNSPFKFDDTGKLLMNLTGESFNITPIRRPRFYDKTTADGTPMKKIAILHGKECLATTLYQKCVLMEQGKGCSFCAIDTSLKRGTTVLKKSPSLLGEVTAEAIKEGVSHLTLTTGTPNLQDHGVGLLSEAVRHIKSQFNIPIHVQLTPPSRELLECLFQAGADTIGIHIETFDRDVLTRHCPGKTDFDYYQTLKNAVDVFGENQVSSFVLGGLGEKKGVMESGFLKLASMGVIPFLVPFRPLPGSTLQNHPAPEPLFMKQMYLSLAEALKTYGVDIKKNLAGCVRCGACSAVDMAMDSVG